MKCLTVRQQKCRGNKLTNAQISIYFIISEQIGKQMYHLHDKKNIQNTFTRCDLLKDFLTHDAKHGTRHMPVGKTTAIFCQISRCRNKFSDTGRPRLLVGSFIPTAPVSDGEPSEIKFRQVVRGLSSEIFFRQHPLYSRCDRFYCSEFWPVGILVPASFRWAWKDVFAFVMWRAVGISIPTAVFHDVFFWPVSDARWYVLLHHVAKNNVICMRLLLNVCICWMKFYVFHIFSRSISDLQRFAAKC